MNDNPAKSDQSIVMLNALWFKPEGGRELYKQYLETALPFIHAVGGEKLESYEPDRALIGEFDADLVFFIRYPSWEAFKQFLWNEEYQATAVPIREAAISHSLLIRCRPVEI